MPLPDDADLVAAGALMTGHLTAWRMLFGKNTAARRECPDRRYRRRRRGRLPATRQNWWAHGSSSPRRATPRSTRAVAMGASGGVNYQRDRVSNAILQMSDGGVDMVIDSVGEASWGRSLRSPAARRAARHLRRDDRFQILLPIFNAYSSASWKSTDRPAAALASFASCSTFSTVVWSSPSSMKRLRCRTYIGRSTGSRPAAQFGKVSLTGSAERVRRRCRTLIDIGAGALIFAGGIDRRDDVGPARSS